MVNLKDAIGRIGLCSGSRVKACGLFALIAVIFSTGCATQSQFLQSKQGIAIQTAMSRAHFEMNCPEAAPTLLSKEVVQPALQGPALVVGADALQR
jgi:hypothetical protein